MIKLKNCKKIMKKCKKCNNMKILWDFVKNPKCRDKFGNICKACERERRRDSDRKLYVENKQVIKICSSCNVEYLGNRDSVSTLCISCGKKGSRNGMYGAVREKHWNWNTDITDYEREVKRNYHEYEQFIKDVFERDDYTCQITKEKGGRLVVHHLHPYSVFPDKRTDVNNGITLSYEIHKLFHDTYGYKNFSYDDFLEFCTKYKNQEFNN